MDFKIKVEQDNSHHTRLTIFANGANCGTLTMLGTEAFAFITLLEKGLNHSEGINVVITKGE